MQVALVRGVDTELLHATVQGRVHDHDGKPIGIANTNPLLDSRQYEAEYIDGQNEELTANLIAEVNRTG